MKKKTPFKTLVSFLPGDFLMKNTWIHRIEFHSEEQLVRGLQSCKYTKNNVKQNFKNSS